MSKEYALDYAKRLSADREFCSAYMDIRNLRSLILKHPDYATEFIVRKVYTVIYEQWFFSQTMSRLLYRECAKILGSIGSKCADKELSGLALNLLVDAASFCEKHSSIESSYGLGILDFDMAEIVTPKPCPTELPEIDFDELLKLAGANGEGGFSGRSYVVKTGENEILAIKIARKQEGYEGLYLEGAWTDLISKNYNDVPVRFDCPKALKVEGSVVFKLKNIVSGAPDNLHEKGYAMAYHAHSDYFVYPNDDREGFRTDSDAFIEIMSRNSYLLGYLAGKGIIHEAPIPLFHNRVQAGRRDDSGVYEWHRFGRLDRWLESCQYPNFGKSGLRDFEHLVAVKSGKEKFFYGCGSHFMAILLVIGSWFRAKDGSLRGLDCDGKPVNSKHLFDANIFESAIKACFANYYEGFTGCKFENQVDLRVSKLVEAMIEEMGVDRHMQEFMRVADQQILSIEEFRKYLVKCGMSRDEAYSKPKGEYDIELVTGPHLGDFNRTISLPEIIEWSAMAAGCCIAAKSINGRWPDINS